MHRFHLPPNEWQSSALALSGAEAHHAGHVLRLQPGDRAVVFDGRGREATTDITAVDSTTVHLRVLHEALTAPLRCHIALAQAIPKGKNMDLIVQKAVEIGAAEIFPLLSARTVVQLDPESAAQKQAKWQSVAIEAAKQCGQNWLPQVHEARTPEEFFRDVDAGVAPAPPILSVAPTNPQRGGAAERHPERPTRAPRHFDLQLVGSLQPGARHLKEILSDYEDEQEQEESRRPRRVLMAIGPEGDFTPAEISLARSHGCVPLTLGPVILRVETAAIYCLSILSYELL
ncbi:MAG: 16S rRNA (uracil(1498)-N(3))-methyltransferase [Chthoniobacterales bacterium]|nr:16S rRNA (uracil(1498)-N(3))-methyltransferase [Chthoniobacterales bacterium]